MELIKIIFCISSLQHSRWLAWVWLLQHPAPQPFLPGGVLRRESAGCACFQTPSAPERPEAPFSLLWLDSSISTPTLEMRQLSIYSARRAAQKTGLSSHPCPLSSVAPTPSPSWFIESSALKWLAAPNSPALENCLSRGLLKPEGQGGQEGQVGGRKGCGLGSRPGLSHCTSSMSFLQNRMY